MSEYIKTYKPPTISKYELERGVRYVETPTQKDWLGQDIAVGDIVLYTRVKWDSAEISIAKIVGMYTRGNVKDEKIRGETVVSIVVQNVGVNTGKVSVRKQGTQARKLVKLHPTQYTDKVTKELIEA
jgi:hypothetical protein